jgi:CheY-like chemotaxis protein
MINAQHASKALTMTERQIILVVEDDPIIREVMQDALEDEGFDAVCAESTQGAIDMIEDSRQIDAVFADIDLGDRGGGYEVARQARRCKPDIKIIYTSGGARDDFTKERVEDALFVQKPYNPSQVCSLLKSKLAS